MRTAVLLLLLAAPYARAQYAPVPIEQAHLDFDGDTVPDRLGDTLTVAGRVSAGPDELTQQVYFAAIQDPSGGLVLYSPDPAPAIARGDSVVATGVVRQFQGLTEVELLDLRVVDVPRQPVQPAPYAPEMLGELMEGELVAIEGRVAGEITNAPVELTVINVGGALVNVVDLSDRGLFASLQPGDPVRVVGVLSQYDEDAPYTSGYQVLPRGEADVQPQTLRRRVLAAALLGFALLALASLAWVYLLRREVQRRVAHQAASEWRYKALFDRVGDAVVVARMEGLRPVEFHLNPAAARLTGYPIEAHAGLRVDRMYRPFSALRRMVARALRDGEARAEMDMVRADGTTIPVEVQTYRFDALEGDHLIFLARDVSRRRAYEQALIAARQEAEDLARMQASFVANMSHELRTPLAGIIGFADILTTEVEDPDHREFAQLIAQGGERLLETLNSVLDLARLDAVGYAPDLEDVDIAESVRTTLDLLQALATQKGIGLVLEAPEQAMHARLDPAALDRIVTNLVGNAIKFTERGRVTVRLERAGESVRLIVADTGRGISSAFIERLYEPFTQESHTMNRSHEGTGLGLSITRHLVSGLGGTIDVTSEKGAGTTFEVTLPLGVQPRTTHPTALHERG